MKRLVLLLIVGLLSVTGSFAQRNNIDPAIQAERDMKAIENNMLKDGTDQEGVKLIKEHSAAKRKMDATMKKIPGYGKAATDKIALAKFREKNAKKDPSFAELSSNEEKTRMAKEDYISGANDDYKSLRQKTAK